jgi:hypothetical protein
MRYFFTLLILMLVSAAHAQFQIFPVGSNNFDSDTSIYVKPANTAGNIWTIGTPSKTFLNGAHSGVRAAITDSALTYPVNNESILTVIIDSTGTDMSNTVLSWWQSYDIDSLGTDKGFIEASYDKGLTWTALKDSFSEGCYRWDIPAYSYDSLFLKGKKGFHYCKFEWQWMLAVIINNDHNGDPMRSWPAPDSLLVRFRLRSDAVNHQNEGWLIDDIHVEKYWGPGSVNERSSQTIHTYPNPARENIWVNVAGASDSYDAVIIDLTGRKVRSMHSGFNNFSININDLSAGIYLLTVKTGQGIVSKEIEVK